MSTLTAGWQDQNPMTFAESICMGNGLRDENLRVVTNLHVTEMLDDDDGIIVAVTVDAEPDQKSRGY